MKIITVGMFEIHFQKQTFNDHLYKAIGLTPAVVLPA